MPRISLYKPERGNDYKFLDRQISEMFTVGGTDIHVYKYLGTDDGETVKDHTQIQDMLFLENRDRKYDSDIYRLRGIYNVQDIDFDLSQFGLFLSNDTLFMTVHIKDSVNTIGRKLMPGDVFELPHLIDEYAENDFSLALKRFYVVEDINRAAEGFSQTWWPHLYRIKLKQIYDGQEFKDILDLPASEEEPDGDTLRDLLSTYEKEMQVSQAVITEAVTEVQKSGFNISHYYSIATTSDGKVEIINSETGGDLAPPDRLGYNGYLVTDNSPPNGADFGFGNTFPSQPEDGDYFLRTDFLPNRLFLYKAQKWTKIHDVKRSELFGSDTANNLKGTFINNTRTSNIGGEEVPERQALSKILKAKADNAPTDVDQTYVDTGYVDPGYITD